MTLTHVLQVGYGVGMLFWIVAAVYSLKSARKLQRSIRDLRRIQDTMEKIIKARTEENVTYHDGAYLGALQRTNVTNGKIL